MQKLKSVLSSLIILAFLVLYSLKCDAGDITKPPDGEFESPWEAGIMKGQYRIYADKDWLDDWNDPSDELAVEVDSQYMPDNRTLIWIARDPDDPANNTILDPDDQGDDNIGQTLDGYNVEFQSLNHAGNNYQDSMFATYIDNGHETSVEIIVPPEVYTQQYKCGDNYVLVVKMGDLDGDSIVSDTMTLWKRLMLEYDYASDCDVGDSTVLEMLIWAYSGNVYGTWYPDNCPWIEVKFEHILLPEDTVPQIVPSDIGIYYEDLEACAYQYKDDRDQYPMHLLSVDDYEDGTDDDGGTNDPNYPEWEKWSFLFMTNINDPPTGFEVNEWKGAVAVHELGHQMGRLRHDPLNYQHDLSCIMRADLGGSYSHSPRFCPNCVRILRWEIIYF